MVYSTGTGSPAQVSSASPYCYNLPGQNSSGQFIWPKDGAAASTYQAAFYEGADCPADNMAVQGKVPITYSMYLHLYWNL